MNKRILLTPILPLAILLSLLLSACQGETISDQAETISAQPTTAVSEPTAIPTPAPEEATPESTAAPEPTAVPTTVPEEVPPAGTAVPEDAPAEPTAQPAWVSSDITVTMADGLEIAGTLTLPEAGDPVPAVLLLHMLGSNQQAWSESDLLTTLNDNGYGTLTIDMRGHGATGGARDWDLAETDLLVVWQTLRDLPEVDGQATAVIGASIGANLALRLAADVPQIDTAVLLSPGIEYRGVTTDDALADYGERPLFYAVSVGDGYSADSVTALSAQTSGPKQVEIFEGSAHGTRMLTAQETLAEMIISWLDQHVETGD